MLQIPMFLYDFLSIFQQVWLKLFNIDLIVVKIRSSNFNIYLFYYSHFIWLIIFCLINVIIFRNILFITIYAFIVKKINTNADCKQISRTT